MDSKDGKLGSAAAGDVDGTHQRLRPLFQELEALRPMLARGAAVLTPNRRLSRAVRSAEHSARSRAGEVVWGSSQIMPIRQYWTERGQAAVTRGELAPRVLLDARAQRFLWQRVIESDAAGFSLLSAPRAAALCQQAAEQLSLWQLSPRDPAVAQQFSFDEDGRAFLRWQAEVDAAMRDAGASTPEQLLLEWLAATPDNPRGDRAELVLLHTGELVPLHRSLCDRVPACTAVVSRKPRALLAPARLYADSPAELQAAAAWGRACVENDPCGRYAIVLSAMEDDRDELEYLLRREFNCLTGDYDSLPVNFSTGFSLDRAALVRDALGVLDVCAAQVSVERVIALLHSRFLPALPLAPEAAERAVRTLRELAREQIPQRVLRAVLDPLLPGGSVAPWQRLATLESQGRWQQRARRPSEWLEPLRQMLDAWGWSRGRSLDSLEYQQLVQWQEVLDSFAQLDPVVGELEFSSALQLLRQCLADTPFQPRTEDRALQVLGPLETTGLDFDALWATGMSHTQWPAAPRPNPYLPFALQRDKRMPHVDATWERGRARERWDDWRGGCGTLHTSFVALKDGSPVGPSPLLSEVAIEEAEGAYTPDPRWAAQARDIPIDARHLEPVPLSATEAAAASVGSSVLEQQANCPFQAFAATRLRSSPAVRPASGLFPSERGAMLHRALYEIFATLGDSDSLKQSRVEERLELIHRSLERAQQTLSRLRLDVLGPAVIALELRRLSALLQDWLALEAQRTVDFCVIARESERSLRLGALEFRLRLDRMDQLADGSRLLIDYKSGAPDSISKWFARRPQRPQLLVYALLEPPVDGLAYASLKPGQLGFSGVAERAGLEGIKEAAQGLSALPDGIAAPMADSIAEPAMAQLRSFWREELESLAAEFAAGESAVDPVVGACRYCQRFALCRLGDNALAGQENEESEP